MSDRVRCDSCKQMVPTECPHRCYNHDHVIAVQDSELAVVEDAERYADAYDAADNADDEVLYAMTRNLLESVRALRATRDKS